MLVEKIGESPGISNSQKEEGKKNPNASYTGFFLTSIPRYKTQSNNRMLFYTNETGRK